MSAEQTNYSQLNNIKLIYFIFLTKKRKFSLTTRKDMKEFTNEASSL